jgi:hypothetical protein
LLAQNHIGWGQIFKGRLSIQWAYLYHCDILQPNINIINPSIDKWGQSILTLSMQFALDMWELRNAAEHDVDGDPVLARKRKLAGKIFWMITQIDPILIPEYDDLVFDDLVSLPIHNLLMLEIQMHPRNWPH